MRMKYIMVEFEHEHAGKSIAPVLFPDVINHVDMFENLQRRPYRADLVSAGFVEIFTKDGQKDITVNCFGESESLSRAEPHRSKSRGEEDAVIIKMVTQGWTCSDPEYIEKNKAYYK